MSIEKNNIDNDDELIFLDEVSTGTDNHQTDMHKGDLLYEQSEPWQIAIIDDEAQVHEVTKMVLSHFQYNNRPLEFLCAYNAKQGLELFQQNNGIAVCLLDVVMETDNAGLELVRQIRAMGNHFTRIVLRTGQPGQAPEEQVILEYDINDYKEKTELTRTKLITLMHSCLKTYEYIMQQEQTRMGLEQVIKASSSVFCNHYVDDFVHGILTQISSLFNYGRDIAMLSFPDGFAAHEQNQQLKIISGIGEYENIQPQKLDQLIPEHLYQQLRQQQGSFELFHDEHCFIASYQANNSRDLLLFSGDIKDFTPLQYHLVAVFCQNVLVAFENMFLKMEANQAQSEMVFILGEAVETRSRETGYHLKRVAQISNLLAQNMDLEENFIKLLKQASPLHDIGKIAIPDAILNKPGKLTPDEWEMMKTHAEAGHKMLINSKKEVMRLASRICLEHHERWDGKGYPAGLREQQISLEGRIVAVADVFDALASKRCYKAAWSLDQVFDYMKEGRGTQFDPEIIDVLLTQKQEIVSIYQHYQ